MHQTTEALDRCREELRTFVRNRYFYGKLLDVHHFESEQSYFNQKRWLLNRMISGYGVVCGLNVGITEDGKKYYVESGLALDQAGRELVVPVRSKLQSLPDVPPLEETPEAQQQKVQSENERDKEDYCSDEDHRHCFHVCIRWHECASDPELVRVGSPCQDETAPCAPGSIRERYEIFVRDGRAPKIDWCCDIVDLFTSGRLNYATLAHYVTDGCPKVPKDPCIPLANLWLKPNGDECSVDVDVTVRPIVYTNDLLFELLICALLPAQNRQRGGKY